MQAFRDFLRWHNRETRCLDFEGYAENGYNLPQQRFWPTPAGSTLPNLAKNCLQKSNSAKNYLLTDSDKDMPEKIYQDIFSGPLIVFTRKAAVEENLIHKSSYTCKSMVGMDGTSQLHLYAMCQPKPTVIYTRRNPTKIWKDSNFKHIQNKTSSFERASRHSLKLLIREPNFFWKCSHPLAFLEDIMLYEPSNCKIATHWLHKTILWSPFYLVLLDAGTGKCRKLLWRN